MKIGNFLYLCFNRIVVCLIIFTIFFFLPLGTINYRRHPMILEYIWVPFVILALLMMLGQLVKDKDYIDVDDEYGHMATAIVVIFFILVFLYLFINSFLICDVRGTERYLQWINRQ